ncbi:MAG: aminopeptidase P family protein [Ruminococcus sp.]|nr:aminopeptidase P family protein [Ruminococcus sp.]
MNKFDKLFAELPEDVESVLITSDVNRRYFTGMKSSAGTVIAFRDKAYLIIDFRYIEKARAVVKNAEVIEQKALFSQLQKLLHEHSAGNMAIESQTMTVSELALYKKSFPEIKIISNDMLSNGISTLRTVKDEEEIACIRKAQEIAEAAFEHILGFIKPGVTEREIALELDYQMLRLGAEALSFDTIALAGANTSMPHGVPSDKKVEQGEFVLMDFGAVYNGYHSDMTRTVCVGEPTDEMKRVYDIVLEAQLACLEKAHGGMTGSELDKIARDIIDDAGYGDCFGHSLGHGVGMEIHERPNAAPSNKNVFRSGTVVTVEPGIYIAGKFGIRIEDFVILTENGNVNLTKCVKNIISL